MKEDAKRGKRGERGALAGRKAGRTSPWRKKRNTARFGGKKERS